jgi:hypothetical protein
VQTSRACGLVQLLLKRLDTASDHIESLNDAFQAEDPHRALRIDARLKQTWNDAHTLIFVLEQVSGTEELHARAALARSYQNARVPLVLAWSLISRLPAYRSMEAKGQP